MCMLLYHNNCEIKPAHLFSYLIDNINFCESLVEGLMVKAGSDPYLQKLNESFKIDYMTILECIQSIKSKTEY